MIPLPKPDGSAEANREPHPEGGYTYDEVDTWSEPLVRAYAAAAVAEERERCARVCRFVLGSDEPEYANECAAAIRAGAGSGA